MIILRCLLTYVKISKLALIYTHRGAIEIARVFKFLLTWWAHPGTKAKDQIATLRQRPVVSFDHQTSLCIEFVMLHLSLIVLEFRIPVKKKLRLKYNFTKSCPKRS